MNVDRGGEIDLEQVKYVASTKSDLRLEDGDILFNNTNSPVWVGKTAVVRGAGARLPALRLVGCGAGGGALPLDDVLRWRLYR